MCTSKGVVKKTELSKYGRSRAGGIIAIKLRDDDKLIDAIVTRKDNEIGEEQALRPRLNLPTAFCEFS